MRKTKILVVSNYNDFHSVRPEAEIFISLSKRGYDITVMTFADSEYADRFQQAGITVIDHHPTRRYEKQSISKIRQLLLDGNYDVLHLFNNKSLTNGLRAAKGLPVTVIGYRGSTLNFAWYNPFNYFKHLSPRLDFVICNSKGVASRYISHPFFRSTKAVVINKGHKREWYTDTKVRDLRKEYKINETTPIAILVATDRTMKGVKYLVSAVNELPADTDFRLFMIGGGMDDVKYRKALQSGPHNDKVITLGHTPNALEYVAGSDIFVLPSIKGESITKAVLESMALGLCPIITDIAGNHELVQHKINGIVVKASDSSDLAVGLAKILADKTSIKKYGKASQQKIDGKLNHNRTVEAYEKLYNKINGTS